MEKQKLYLKMFPFPITKCKPFDMMSYIYLYYRLHIYYV